MESKLDFKKFDPKNTAKYMDVLCEKGEYRDISLCFWDAFLKSKEDHFERRDSHIFSRFSKNLYGLINGIFGHDDIEKMARNFGNFNISWRKGEDKGSLYDTCFKVVDVGWNYERLGENICSARNIINNAERGKLKRKEISKKQAIGLNRHLKKKLYIEEKSEH